ncbi:MAG: GDSL-type esterase/lipase family protein [Treponema sp.]|nr:GDSL-type esterase/lipase family protein [Treponema sp.]
MKKTIIKIISIFSLTSCLFAADFKATKGNVKLLGRTYFDGDILWNCFSATGATFVTDSSKVEITLAGDNKANGQPVEGNTAICRVAVFVDGERTHNVLMQNREEKIQVYENKTGKHEIRIVKLSETGNSVFGIKNISVDDGKIISPVEDKKLKIEFVGDSITCGYGVDDENRNHHFSTQTEDATKTYAYKTAANLNADYSMVSCSGWGIISGYSGDGLIKDKQVMKMAYDKTGFTYNGFGKKSYMGQRLPWDFSTWQPDIVVINLGTNDASYTKRMADRCKAYEEGYVEFLKMVRANNPEAQIVCILGLMGSDLFLNIQNAVKTYSAETGDEKVTCVKIPQTSVYAADWHPAEKGHENAANVLTDALQKYISND